jgi:hypothetical protein
MNAATALALYERMLLIRRIGVRGGDEGGWLRP